MASKEITILIADDGMYYPYHVRSRLINIVKYITRLMESGITSDSTTSVEIDQMYDKLSTINAELSKFIFSEMEFDEIEQDIQSLYHKKK
ncbi:hypothetical protein SAMN05444416_112134 [Thermoactinomyces sp. DSM 45892]|nr:hypothetical protein SAMN05444416_112134 [Thermoactinomyces sp. DSM 45892]